MIFDKNSSTWLLFEKAITKERTDLLDQLACENISERESDVIRGKIAMIEYIESDIKDSLTREED